MNKYEHTTGTLAMTLFKPMGKKIRMSGVDIAHSQFIKSTSSRLWTPPPSLHTTPCWSVTPVDATPRSVLLFSAVLYLDMILLHNTCPATYWSVPLCDSPCCSVPLCPNPYDSSMPTTAPFHPCFSVPLYVAPSKYGLSATPLYQHMSQ